MSTQPRRRLSDYDAESIPYAQRTSQEPLEQAISRRPRASKTASLFDPKSWAGHRVAFVKLDPRAMIEEPGHVRGRGRWRRSRRSSSSAIILTGGSTCFVFQIIMWLWFTVLFANFAEAIAEGRGKAQAETLRARARRRRPSSRARHALAPMAQRLSSGNEPQGGRHRCWSRPATSSPPTARSSKGSPPSTRRRSPANPRPVIREVGGDRSAVTGGTQVLSDWIRVRDHRGARHDLPGPHDRAGRRRRAAEDPQRDRPQHPARRPDHHLRRSRPPPSRAIVAYAGGRDVSGGRPGGAVRHSDPDDHRRAAFAPSASPAWTGWCASTCSRCRGRAVEAAGDVDTLLLDKTGTITLGNRQATEFMPAAGVIRAGPRRCRPARLAGRRNAGGPLHRGAGQGEIRHPRPRARRDSSRISFPSPRKPA